MSRIIDSPLRYPGGKSRAADRILSLIPRDFEEYREAFIGGGSIYIALKQKYPNRKFWINDLYFDLYNFWKICQVDIDSVSRQILLWKNEFSNGKELYNFLKSNLYKFNRIENASAFFIFNRITFSGIPSGGCSEDAFKKRFTQSSLDRLLDLKKILKDTKITNLDYQKLVEEKGENVYIFLDPPYYSATKSALYGKAGKENLHKRFDHYRFANTMRRCDHKWLVTYDNSPFIRKLFSFANIIPWNLTYGMKNVADNSNQVGEEIFISNYLEIEEVTKTKQATIDDLW